MDQVFELASRRIIKGDCLEFTKIIEEHPGAVNQEVNGETLLHIACDNGKTDIVEIILNAGCELNKLNDEGETPLHLAVYRGYKNIVTLLLKHKADPLLKNLQGKDSFTYAREFDEIEIMKILDTFRELNTDDLCYSYSSESSVIFTPVSAKYLNFLSPGDNPVVNFDAVHSEISTFHSGGLFNQSDKKNCPHLTKTVSNFSVEDVLDFLESLKLRKYFKNFISHGFDCFDSLLLQMKTPLKIDLNVLKLLGITDENDMKIIVESLQKQSVGCFVETRYQNLFLLLEDINLENYYLNFSDSHLVKLDQLVLEAKKNMNFLERYLEDSLKIMKYGHRLRIIGLLQAQETSSNTRCLLL
jgi:hypothetical protein